MKYLKTFENQQLPSINILLDVSGSVSKELVKAAFYLTDFGEYNKVNFIQFTNDIESHQEIFYVDKILTTQFRNGVGTDIQVAIDYLVDKGLNNYKTFIFSDFYCEKPDYSKLKDYELINFEKIDPDIDYSIPKEDYHKDPELFKGIKSYNL